MPNFPNLLYTVLVQVGRSGIFSLMQCRVFSHQTSRQPCRNFLQHLPVCLNPCRLFYFDSEVFFWRRRLDVFMAPPNLHLSPQKQFGPGFNKIGESIFVGKDFFGKVTFFRIVFGSFPSLNFLLPGCVCTMSATIACLFRFVLVLRGEGRRRLRPLEREEGDKTQSTQISLISCL